MKRGLSGLAVRSFQNTLFSLTCCIWDGIFAVPKSFLYQLKFPKVLRMVK